MATRRANGWSDALTDAGLEPSPGLVIPLHDYSIAEARATITEALAAGLEIDGIFAVTDEVAIGALAGLHDAGLRVPDDVQLAGFDNLDISQHLAPGLTTVDRDGDRSVLCGRSRWSALNHHDGNERVRHLILRPQ